jgi:hypothetical protein
MAPTDVLTVTRATLEDFRARIHAVLEEIRTKVNISSTNGGTQADGYSGDVPVLNENLVIRVGGPNFGPGVDLAAAVKKMGGSVDQQLKWLETLFSTIETELTYTINAFTENEDVNSELVQEFLNGFSKTVALFGAGPAPAPAPVK